MNIAFLRAAALCSALWLSGTWNPVVAAAGVEPAGEGRLNLSLRRLVQAPGATNQWQVAEQQVTWEAARTAVVVCDMWDQHWCRGATARVAEMAPRMNQAIAALRDQGVLIIHCPSETMRFYKNHPGRKLTQGAPKVDVEAQRRAWAGRARQEDPPHPIDSSDGGCDCQPQCQIPPMPPFPWQRQIGTLEIKEGDAITDGVEAYYLMRQRGITNVIVMGVHENMCVLNRSFAIKQMVRLGQNVALMRDLTDTMYNSRRRPQVDHFTGNDLMTWHIEKYWCPTLTSDQLLGGQPFRFAADSKPLRVFRN
jgi:nicotinamidase-related amidase